MVSLKRLEEFGTGSVSSGRLLGGGLHGADDEALLLGAELAPQAQDVRLFVLVEDGGDLTANGPCPLLDGVGGDLGELSEVVAAGLGASPVDPGVDGADLDAGGTTEVALAPVLHVEDV